MWACHLIDLSRRRWSAPLTGSLAVYICVVEVMYKTSLPVFYRAIKRPWKKQVDRRVEILKTTGHLVHANRKEAKNIFDAVYMPRFLSIKGLLVGVLGYLRAGEMFDIYPLGTNLYVIGWEIFFFMTGFLELAEVVTCAATFAGIVAGCCSGTCGSLTRQTHMNTPLHPHSRYILT